MTRNRYLGAHCPAICLGRWRCAVLFNLLALILSLETAHGSPARGTIFALPLSLAQVDSTYTDISSKPDATSIDPESLPHEVLRLYGIDQSTLEFLTDGQPIEQGEWEPLRRILHILRRVDVNTLSQWSRPTPNWDRLTTTPDDDRLQMFQLTGILQQISRHELPNEAASRFGYASLYRLRAQSIDGHPLTLFVPSIPSAWRDHFQFGADGSAVAVTVNVPISCEGLFIKVGESVAVETRDDRQSSRLVFAAARIAWHPHQSSAPLGINIDRAKLGSMGMDLGLLDDLQQHTPLTDSDRECFYQMLWTLNRMPARQLQDATKKLNLVTAIQSPESITGHHFQLSGLARRALRIRVDDADIQQRYGLTHYFEVEVFVPLSKPLKLVDAHDGTERTVRRYPISLCCLNLPASMPQGDRIRQPITVDAYFLKLRTYTSLNAESQRTSQLSPLLVAKSVRLDEVEVKSNPWPTRAIVTLVIGGGLLTGAAGWYYRRGDQRFAAKRREMNRGYPPTDLDRLRERQP